MSTHTDPRYPHVTFTTYHLHDGHNHCYTGSSDDELYCVFCRQSWREINEAEQKEPA